MLNDEELLKFIITECKNQGVTGYDIGKNTSITEQSAYRILDGSTKKPRRKNLIQILEYLEKRIVGTQISTRDESKTYQSNTQIQEDILKVEEQVENIYRKIPITEVFSDVGTELLISLKKNVTLSELTIDLFKKNTRFMEEKIAHLLTSQH